MTTFQPIKYQLNVKLINTNDNFVNHYTTFTNHHNGDSGIDLLSEILEVAFLSVGTIDFGIQCEMIDLETNMYTSYRLAPRSSISKTGFQLANSEGIIDAGYRGNLMAKVRQFDPEGKSLLSGSYFQIIGPDLKPIKVVIVNELSTTSRGDGGFGSTNK
jgi:dUTP pyrophosphatase